MRKWKVLLLTATAGIILSNCSTEKKITYIIPPNYPETERKQLLAELDQGKMLYKEYCTACHGIFKKGVDSIPDFSKQQINLYAERFMFKDLKNHAIAMEIGGDQVYKILSFLRFRATKGLKPDASGRKM
jgi:cytochrome c5